MQAPSFYWEIEIVSYGDSEEDSGPIVSFGFATEAEKRDGAWTNPVGTCLFHKYADSFVPYIAPPGLSLLSADCDPSVCPSVTAGRCITTAPVSCSGRASDWTWLCSLVRLFLPFPLESSQVVFLAGFVLVFVCPFN